jgi:hypothetical protein
LQYQNQPPHQKVSICFAQEQGDNGPETFVKVSAVEQQATPPEIAAVLDDYKDVFPNELPDGLPPSRDVNFKVIMKADAQPSMAQRRMRLSLLEQKLLDAFVTKLSSKGWIRISNSPWVASVFGVPKKGDDNMLMKRSQWLKLLTEETPVRWVLDYRYTNSQQEIPRIPLPNIEDLFDQMAGARIFSKLDLASGYHQMLVEEASRKYTAFRTHKETYEWCVAPMGLAGVPGLWSRMMNSVFGKLLFVIVYMDDIAVCSKTMEEHADHLRQVFELMRAHILYGRLTKCEFGVDKIAFLGHEVSAQGLAVDANKIRAIEKWTTPTNRKQLMSFLGLAGYYRKFICDYATIVLPLSQIAREKVEWQWNAEQQAAFEVIKVALQQAPVLQLADPDRPFVVTTDASGYCCGAVLSQIDNDGNDRPIAFLSKTLGVHEINWPAYEQELFAIKIALTKYRHFLLGQHFDVFTDNSACKWMLTTQELNPKMTRNPHAHLRGEVG